MCGKYFKRKHRIAKDMKIEHINILVPGQGYQDFRHLLLNPKVSKNVMGFNNHAQIPAPPYYLDVDNPFQRASKVDYWFKSGRNFAEWVNFACWWSCSSVVSAIKGATQLV